MKAEQKMLPQTIEGTKKHNVDEKAQTLMSCTQMNEYANVQTYVKCPDI